MKYAIIETGGKQYRVSEGKEILVEKLDGDAGHPVTFAAVLFFTEAGKYEIGQPFLGNVNVRGKILDQLKGEKLRIATYKAKSRYRRVKGHRQRLTRVLIEAITRKAKTVTSTQS